MSAVRRAFDVGSFFTRAIPLMIVNQLRTNPLDPMPHMRAGRALVRADHAGTDR